MTSSQTSPTKVSDGPLLVGSLGWISNFLSFVSCFSVRFFT
jgi:hypothetical protein